jgi:hypothetical protein
MTGTVSVCLFMPYRIVPLEGCPGPEPAVATVTGNCRREPWPARQPDSEPEPAEFAFNIP